VNGETFQQPDYFIRECVQCGLLYRSETLSPADFARYYAKVDGKVPVTIRRNVAFWKRCAGY